MIVLWYRGLVIAPHARLGCGESSVQDISQGKCLHGAIRLRESLFVLSDNMVYIYAQLQPGVENQYGGIVIILS